MKRFYDIATSEDWRRQFIRVIRWPTSGLGRRRNGLGLLIRVLCPMLREFMRIAGSAFTWLTDGLRLKNTIIGISVK